MDTTGRHTKSVSFHRPGLPSEKPDTEAMKTAASTALTGGARPWRRVRQATAASLLLLLFLHYLPLPSSESRLPASAPQQQRVRPHSGQDIDWSRYAYAQYVTNTVYLCNSLMLFERLQHLGSRADRIMLYPNELLPDPAGVEAEEDAGRLLIRARDEFSVKLIPVEVTVRPESDATWASSFTKLLIFNQTQYDRVLAMDSDSTVLQNMDELFLLPSAPVAMPRAYWLESQQRTLTSGLILAQPSSREFSRIQAKVADAGPKEYDMEILNQLYADSALIIPHRPYLVLTGEFRQTNHSRYLGDPNEEWNPVMAFNEAKFLHFSDYPVPKPWMSMQTGVMEENEPPCEESGNGVEDCSARDLWHGFYTDFEQRRKSVCEA